MALEVAYTDEFGNDYNKSFWVVSKMNLDLVNRTWTITFDGYKNKGAKQANKRNVGKIDIFVSGADFDQVMTNYNAGQKDLIAIAYTRALASQFFSSANTVAD